MYKTFTKINNIFITFRKPRPNQCILNPENIQSLNIQKYIKSSRNFRKTNNNLRTNLSLKTFHKDFGCQYNVEDEQKRNIFSFHFNKAPSMKENYNNINKLVRLKKKERIKNFETFYNKLLISEAELYRNKLCTTPSSYGQTKKSINKIIKSFSSEELPIKKNSKNINKIKKFQKPNIIKYDKNSITTNKFNSQNKFSPSILRNKRTLSSLTKNDLEKQTQYALKTITKIHNNLISSLHNQFAPMKLANTEKRLVKFRTIQKIQKRRMKNYFHTYYFIIENYLRRLKHLEKIYKKKYETYSKQMNFYLRFLYDTLNKSIIELSEKKEEVLDLNAQIEKLIIKIIYKQIKLEYFVRLRNSLLKIKNINEKNEKPEQYYDLLLIRDSKILLIENCLNNIKFIKQIKNEEISRFMSHLQNLKDTIANGKKNFKLTEEIFDSLDLNNEQTNQIFSSPDIIITLYENLTITNLNLLNILQYSKKSEKKFKDIYHQELINMKEEYEDKTKFEEINKCEKKKKELIEKNVILNKKLLFYKSGLDYKLNLNKIETLKDKKKKPKYLDYNVNLDVIKQENYYNQMKKYKYQGLLVLDKLINIIKQFLKLKYSQRFIKNLQNRNRLRILEVNIKSYDDFNLTSINTNILKALSLYEDICKYVLNIHDNLEQDKNNLLFMKEQKNIMDYEKKIQNVKNQKEVTNIKNIDKRKKIYQKSTKPVLYIQTKINAGNLVQIIKIKNDRIKQKNKNLKDEEMSGLIKFHDD